MSAVHTQIQAQDDFVRDILAISGCPALSVGVLSHGQIVHTAHYGTRNVAEHLRPDDDTMYRVASLTKALAASAVAALVKDGLLSWDTPVREYLPDFRERQDDIGLKSTLRDLLSNRTGLANGDFYWGQQHGEFLMPHNELVRTAAHVPAVKPFRKRFVYASWNYGLVTEVVEAVAGVTLGQFIDRRFLKPLGMERTTLADTADYENIALGYGIDVDGSCHNIPFQQMNDGIGLAAAYGGKSSIRDLLVMYRELLKAQNGQAQSGDDSTPGSPFTHTRSIFEPHIGVFGPTSYCLGLYKTVLPGALGIASLNTIALLGLKNAPIMGQSVQGLEIWHHTGNMPTCMSSMFLVPKTQTAVVVLTNAVGFLDPTDFIAQQLLAVLLGEKPNEKYRGLAQAARAANLKQYPKYHAQLIKGYTGKCTRPSRSYEGHYWNAAGNFCLTITTQSNGRLRMKVQDVPLTGYDLEPYNEDVWWWPPNRKKELCEKGMWAYTSPNHYLISFMSSAGDAVDRLIWHHDPTTPKPETFVRSERKPSWKGYPVLKPRL